MNISANLAIAIGGAAGALAGVIETLRNPLSPPRAWIGFGTYRVICYSLSGMFLGWSLPHVHTLCKIMAE
jgi:hypothetical protein